MLNDKPIRRSELWRGHAATAVLLAVLPEPDRPSAWYVPCSFVCETAVVNLVV